MRKARPVARSSSRLCVFLRCPHRPASAGDRTCTRTPTPPRRLPRRPPPARRPSSTPSGCRSRRTASSRARRACSPRPKACTTGRPRAARCSTASPASGASTPATRGRRSSQAIAAQAAEMDFAPPFNMAHPKAFELAEKLVALAPAGPRQGVLHQLGLGGGRHRAEDGDRLPPRARRRPAHAPDRPRARLPRRQLRRHLGRRHRRQPQDLRHHARRRRPHAPHPRPGAQRVLARPARARRRARRRPRAASSRCTTRRRSPR